jgi:L-fuculose-phosphate aldolase
MLKNICAVLKEAYTRGWISTRDGNASYYDQKEFWITPSGITKYSLYPDQMVQLEFVEEVETQIKGDIKMPWEHIRVVSNRGYNPSIELPFHYLIQKSSTMPRCVLHLHPTNIVSAMYAGLDLQYIAQEFAEIKMARDRMFTLAGATNLNGTLQSDVATSNQIARESEARWLERLRRNAYVKID